MVYFLYTVYFLLYFLYTVYFLLYFLYTVYFLLYFLYTVYFLYMVYFLMYFLYTVYFLLYFLYTVYFLLYFLYPTFELGDLPGGALGEALVTGVAGQRHGNATAAQQEANLLTAGILLDDTGRGRGKDKLIKNS
ncbi:hypothetical protein EYF80_066476 [Liparis tanakae]|uniref:Uncharacterized protein n=1 Tax=Liparis tanakae TaxID=230148 RepID=A0A4Z2E3X0_9TELE|nr:hypothetical protein EYF80_066476 [Liparis tanakae]